MIALPASPITIHTLGENMSLKSHKCQSESHLEKLREGFFVCQVVVLIRDHLLKQCIPTSPLTFSSKCTDALPQIIVAERV